jgi:DNA polymerase-3 subunit gamma/tau
MADHDDLNTDSAPPWEEEPAERDANTADIFGAPPAAEAAPVPAVVAPPPVAVEASSDPDAAYTVLARKYRPRTFEDLIGQEAMVRTLANAFSSGRIAHAFMLTGVRGVGKTTTARLLARALNYETDTVHQPSVDLTVDGRHCKSIIEGGTWTCWNWTPPRAPRSTRCASCWTGCATPRSRRATRSTSSTKCTCCRRRRSTPC